MTENQHTDIPNAVSTFREKTFRTDFMIEDINTMSQCIEAKNKTEQVKRDINYSVRAVGQYFYT